MEKLIPNFSAYKINNQGEVYSRWVCLRAVKPRKFTLGNQWKIIKPVYDKSCGYMIVTLIDDNGKRFNKRIHRLLMEAFVPNPQGFKHINHIDGNRGNNSVDNLEWCTQEENEQHAINILGKTMKGKTNPKTVLCVELNKTFKSMRQAILFLGNHACNEGIKKAIEANRPYHGYTFKFINNESSTTIESISENDRSE